MGLSDSITQDAFGRLVGISQPAVSDLMQRGILEPGASGHDWLLAYCERLREIGAGRQAADGGLDLVQERAALARAQRESFEIKNAVLRQEYAPVELLSRVLAIVSDAVASRIDAMPAALRAACPGLDPAAYRVIEDVLTSARTDWQRSTAALADADLAGGDDSDTDVEDLES